MSSLKIVDIERVEKDKWSNFVYNHHHGNIFSTPEMFEVFNHTKNYSSIGVAALDKNNDIEGILIGSVNKYYRIFSRIVVYGGPIVNTPDIIPQLLKEFNNKVLKNCLIPLVIDIRNMWDTDGYKIFFERNNHQFEEHLNYTIPLEPNLENVWFSIPKNRRKNISRGKSRFLVKELKTDEDIEIAYSLIKSTYKKVKVPAPSKKLLIKAFEILGPKGYLKGLAAYKEDFTVATRIFLIYKDVIYDWYAGSIYGKEGNYSNELLVWTSLELGAKNDYKLFDFGGAGNPEKPYGPREFKRRFGGIEVNWGIYRKINTPLLWRILKWVAKFRYPGISQQVD